MNRISKNKYNGKDRLKSDKKEKKKLTKKQKIIIGSVIGAIALIFLIMIGVYIYKADGNIKDAAINMVADAVGDETPVTALVMGVSTDLENDLTDTIILVGYNPKTQASFMLSIPRDTFVGNNEATANGYDKINALYQKGVKKTVSAVEKLTGVKIDYYVVIKTQALIDVVNAIGGVNFEVPIDMKYDDPTQNLHINLKKGMQLLDGDKAEQLLRFRHSNPDANGKMTTYPASYGSDDFGRMRTQREFITATIKQMVSWKNISKSKNILNAVFENLETNMTLGKMIGYVPSALKLDVSAIRAEQLPGESDLINNLWFYRQDTSETKDLVTELMQSLGLSEKEYNKKYTPIKSKSTNRKVDDNSIKENSSLKNTVKEETQVVDPATCSHDWKLTIDLEPTCVDAGARNYKCSICGTEKSEVISATGEHKWEVKERIDSTELNEGRIVSECTVCKVTKTEYIPKKEPALPDNTVEVEEVEEEKTEDDTKQPDQEISKEGIENPTETEGATGTPPQE